MARSKADWEAIEREYRAGQISVNALAKSYGITEGAIRKRAKKESWPRDMTQAVREEVRSELVRSEVRDSNVRTAVSDAAARGVEVIRSHRKDIARGREITARLLDELDTTTSRLGELEELIGDETAKDKSPQRRLAMERAISLPSRASAMASLAVSMQRLVGLERQAFNLDEAPAETRQVISARPMTEDEWQKAHGV